MPNLLATLGTTSEALLWDVPFDALMRGHERVSLPHAAKGLTIDPGRVELRLADDAVELSVADNGPGIPADERDDVVQRFYRLERSRATPGSGLGLSLVAAVARLHRATLLLEDNHLLCISKPAGLLSQGGPEGEVSLPDLLDRYQRALRGPSRPEAALMFTCLGRGEGLYGEPDHDSQLVRQGLGEVPLAGFFCNGEIGPVHGRTFLHGYTSALAIVRGRAWS